MAFTNRCVTLKYVFRVPIITTILFQGRICLRQWKVLGSKRPSFLMRERHAQTSDLKGLSSRAFLNSRIFSLSFIRASQTFQHGLDLVTFCVGLYIMLFLHKILLRDYLRKWWPRILQKKWNKTDSKKISWMNLWLNFQSFSYILERGPRTL